MGQSTKKNPIYIIGIDPGIVNIGVCVLRIDKPGVYIEKSSLLKNNEEFSKSECDMLVWRWFKKRWNKYIKYAIIVFIEKQLIGNCVIVEICLKCYIQTFSFMNNLSTPLVISKSPKWWKNRIGISSFINIYDEKIIKNKKIGKNGKKLINPNHKINKKKSMIFFMFISSKYKKNTKIHNDKYDIDAENLLKKNPNISIDEVEAFFMAKVCKQYIYPIIKSTKKINIHDNILSLSLYDKNGDISFKKKKLKVKKLV